MTPEIIRATPMKHGEYSAMKGWPKNADAEFCARDGYAVEYVSAPLAPIRTAWMSKAVYLRNYGAPA